MKKNAQLTTAGSHQKTGVTDLIISIHDSLQSIYSHRFIQKICRPMKHEDRLKFFEQFNIKLMILNQNLDMLQKQSCKFETYNTELKNVSPQLREKNDKLVTERNFRHYIRRIQAKYVQILNGGSFNHYKKIARLLKLPPKLQTVDIAGWANRTSKDTTSDARCC